MGELLFALERLIGLSLPAISIRFLFLSSHDRRGCLRLQDGGRTRRKRARRFGVMEIVDARISSCDHQFQAIASPLGVPERRRVLRHLRLSASRRSTCPESTPWKGRLAHANASILLYSRLDVDLQTLAIDRRSLSLRFHLDCN